MNGEPDGVAAPALAMLGARLFSNSVGLAGFYVAARGVGFIRDPIIGSLYGASTQSDAYYVALGISFIACGIALGGTTASVIPVFTARRATSGDASAWTFLMSYLGWVGAAFLGAGLVLGAFPGRFIAVLSPGLSAPAGQVAAHMLRVFALIPFLTMVNATLGSALNCYGRFYFPAMIPLVGNLVSIVLLPILTPPLGIIGAAWAFLIGTIVQTAWLGSTSWRMGRRFRPVPVLRDPDLLKTIRLAIPGSLSEALFYANFFVVIYLATSLGAGMFSAIQYSTKVQQVFIEVFVAAIGVVMFPYLASAARRDREDLRTLHSLNLVMVGLLLLPITALLVMLRGSVIEILYQRRAFDAEATRVTATALGLGALSLVPAGIKDAAVRILYSLHDSMTPLFAIVAAVTLNIVLDFVLAKPFGVGGLMLAFSVATGFLAIVLLVIIARRGVLRANRALTRSLANIGGATLVLCVVVWALGRVLPLPANHSGTQTLAHFVVDVTAGVAAYVGSLFLLGERAVAGLHAWFRAALKGFRELLR